ncbi:MAG: hemolysin III family protein [Eubacteriales bacterium]|nr:hemolysin III family protein [Eubacteriales bacterium]
MRRFHVLKDPGSAITHLIGMVLALFAGIPLLYRAAQHAQSVYLISAAVFIVSMVLLYGASSTYHSLNISGRVNKLLRKLDHMMIFVLISGSYTPVCLLVLPEASGRTLLMLVWGVAIVGILVKACWITCPKWFSSIFYIGMGWLCVLALPQIFHGLSAIQFAWLLAGGIIYTVGGVIYALKLPLFNARHREFGSHEIFHLFVMGGSFCHFMLVYLLMV